MTETAQRSPGYVSARSILTGAATRRENTRPDGPSLRSLGIKVGWTAGRGVGGENRKIAVLFQSGLSMMALIRPVT